MAQAAPQPASQAGAKVTVASKMPNGIVLRGFVESNEREPVMGGGTRDVTIFRENGQSAVVQGTQVRVGVPPPLLFGGYRMTPNVPKDLWDEWLKANRDSDMVRNRLIFAQDDDRRTQDEAKSYGSIETGLEGVDPANPGKSIRSNIQRLERPR